MRLVFEYISQRLAERSGAEQSERSERYNIRRLFLPTVHSYGTSLWIVLHFYLFEFVRSRDFTLSSAISI